MKTKSLIKLFINSLAIWYVFRFIEDDDMISDAGYEYLNNN